jgi:hypothetical protein
MDGLKDSLVHSKLIFVFQQMSLNACHVTNFVLNVNYRLSKFYNIDARNKRI